MFLFESQEMVHALLKNSLMFYTLLFTQSEIQIIREPDILYVLSPITDATYNNVWLTQFDAQMADQRIEEIKNIFASKNLPLMWWVDPSDMPMDLADRLEKLGFTFTEQTSIMYRLQGIPLVPYDPHRIAIQKVTTVQELEDFCLVKGGDAQEVAMNLQLYSKFIEPHTYPIELFVAYHDQDPVSMAVTVCNDTIGSIHSFATRSEAQGRGYGTQMLRFLLERLYSTGCSMVLLDSSEQALKWYEKNGFLEIGKYIKGYKLKNKFETVCKLP